jgi:hypothetical protein
LAGLLGSAAVHAIAHRSLPEYRAPNERAKVDAQRFAEEMSRNESGHFYLGRNEDISTLV